MFFYYVEINIILCFIITNPYFHLKYTDALTVIKDRHINALRYNKNAFIYFHNCY